jgi:hypothetical protein
MVGSSHMYSNIGRNVVLHMGSHPRTQSQMALTRKIQDMLPEEQAEKVARVFP